MISLYDDIKSIKGIGEKKSLAFSKLGIFSLYDLLSYFPRKYDDRSQYKLLKQIQDQESACVKAFVADEPRLVRIRKGLELVKFKIADESGIADVTFFNQPYQKNNIKHGKDYVFYGKFEISGRHISLTNPIFEKDDNTSKFTGKIIPIYKTTNGLSQRDILNSIELIVSNCLNNIEEIIPIEILARNQLADVKTAYHNIHFPSDYESLTIARKRLIFEELFVLSCALGKVKENKSKQKGINYTNYDISNFYSSLPFKPTAAQINAITDSVNDLKSGLAMNRLIQGDVGSGKTLVAACLIYLTYINGHNSIFMAPTEILVDQHYITLTKFLSKFGMKIEKLTGSMSSNEKKVIRDKLKRNEIDLIIGTHALFSEDIEYKNFSLVITDEQHRFGVNQRASIISKANTPHVLVMSATPIPRTLALIIYGDLDVSIIDELPPGRQVVETYVVNESYRQRLNAFIIKQVELGHQAYIVCPKVEESEEINLDLKSAEQYAVDLQNKFPQIKVSCLHGKMKPKDKEKYMKSFVNGETNVLVSTTVIEVGVDVPNATLMIIENAERFGLSQLHQLRGRVGRGTDKSYCILVSDAKNQDIKSRLDIMCKTSDGFKISEEDLRLRGPGDFFGERQHGLPEMHLADLGADTQILKIAQEEAMRVIAGDPTLCQPHHRYLKERITEIYKSKIETLN